MKKHKQRFSDEDLKYMNSLAAAVVQRSSRYLIWLISLVALLFIAIIVWMSQAELDTIVRAHGKVIPSSQLQRVQSLEGGVVAEIMVKEGDMVEIDQPLMKISDISFASSYEENRIKHLELLARIARLKAEANDELYGPDPQVEREMPSLADSEFKLYKSNQAELEKSLSILREQVKQADNQLIENKAQERQVKRNLALVREELKIKKPLVERQVIGSVEYLQLQGKESELQGDLDGIQLAIPRLVSTISEIKEKLEHGRLEFRNKARKQLNETTAEASRINELQNALADRVARTTIRSPVKGTVQRLLSNTIGGVIKPGGDIVEIVPHEDALLIEARIKPADIGSVDIGQLARVKFTAYDFAIYGNIKGEVVLIGADTITNEEGESFYIARIRPDQPYIAHKLKKMPLKVGMVAEVDIVTGKNTVLRYLLKPIYRAMDSAMREG